VALTLLASGWSRCGSNTPPEYKDLFYLPQEQQEEKFKQFPLDKQVDIYMYAMYVEPPLTTYAEYLHADFEMIIVNLFGPNAQTHTQHPWRKPTSLYPPKSDENLRYECDRRPEEVPHMFIQASSPWFVCRHYF